MKKRLQIPDDPNPNHFVFDHPLKPSISFPGRGRVIVELPLQGPRMGPDYDTSQRRWSFDLAAMVVADWMEAGDETVVSIIHTTNTSIGFRHRVSMSHADFSAFYRFVLRMAEERQSKNSRKQQLVPFK